jgi:hypothetical protein
MLDIVLDLYGLLEDFFNELGDLRSVVEKPIREILKVNRIGEIVDSDADEEGNLKWVTCVPVCDAALRCD